MPAKAGPKRRREERKRDNMSYLSEAHFRNFIRDTLHRIIPGASISKEANSVMDNIVKAMYKDIASEARRLMVAAGRRTLSTWDVECAVMVSLRGETANQAVAAGIKAVARYTDLARGA